MIYCHLKDKATLPPGETTTVGAIAQVFPADEQVQNAKIPCPMQDGIWKISAFSVAQTILKAAPEQEVTMLGADVCYLHISSKNPQDKGRPVRSAIAFVLLMIGSALALAWFHSDVDMPTAQQEIFKLITGHEAQQIEYITIPYAIGVGLGVAFFYSLIGKKTISPMEVKLQEFTTETEQAQGKDVPPDG